jgi:hypothetical protein
MLLNLNPCGTAPAAAAAAAAAVVGSEDNGSVVLSSLQRSTATSVSSTGTVAADAPLAAAAAAGGGLSACLSDDPAFANAVKFDDQYTFYWNIVGEFLQARVKYAGVGWVGW